MDWSVQRWLKRYQTETPHDLLAHFDYQTDIQTNRQTDKRTTDRQMKKQKKKETDSKQTDADE